MVKKILLALSAAGMAALPTVANAQYYGGSGYGSYSGYGGYGGSYYGSPYDSYYGGSSYYGGYRDNGASAALVGGLIGVVIGSALASGHHHHRYRYRRY